jgi:rhamnopyranosyl-N-acetylglucosaminyl-diphospho-decaprenol beta-1,3/1,4-galactofuranosyltransferase
VTSGNPPELWAVVVTYARPATLEAMLCALGRQSRPVDHLLIVDNDSDPRVAAIAEAHGAEYLDSGDNIGPAGGVALGMQRVLTQASDDDWILCVDDDDEPTDDDLIRTLWMFAEEMRRADERVAGVAEAGSVYRRQLGVFRRLQDEELTGVVDLDVLFGGSFPMYRLAAVRAVGLYDAELFWGFEEGEYGLRVKGAGYRLCAPGPVFLQSRQGRDDSRGPSPKGRTSADKAAWRRYYSIRNSTVLARRYGGPFAPLVTSVGGAAKSVVALTRARRPLSEVALAPRAAVHGLTGRLGRRVDPGRNHKAP